MSNPALVLKKEGEKRGKKGERREEQGVSKKKRKTPKAGDGQNGKTHVKWKESRNPTVFLDP